MQGGYVGKMLFVDLSTGTIREQELAEDLAGNFIGGYGIGARVLYDMIKPGTDPLGPGNVLGFITGPLTGTGALFGGRYTMVCKSPVTGGFNDANSGGYFGPELKKAGYDAVFISGAAKAPVYLWINDGKVEIRDAGQLWGKDSKETETALIAATGEPKLRAVVIGPAGEKLSLMSCPINDGHRAPARGGGGAVMGSKKLKAIAVRGTGKVPVADSARLKEINKVIADTLKNAPGDNPFIQMALAFGEYGTGATTTASALGGDAPVKNWDGIGGVDFSEASATKIGAFAFDAHYKVRKYACAHCPLGCGAVYKVDAGKWPMEETERPEYETATSFGTLCLNDDVEAILKCNDICNRYGLDTISTGATVAWAIECFEKGLFTKEDTGGLELTWGNAEAIVALTQAIADQAGLGRILALGSAGAAQKLGKGSEFLSTVRGMEVGMHDPKYGRYFARVYQFDPTPGRHTKGGLGSYEMLNPPADLNNYEGTGPNDVAGAAHTEMLNSAGLCMFFMFAAPPDALVNMIAAVTGRSFAQEDGYRAGLRILNMRHAFNLREGLKPADFVISPRVVGKPPQQNGPNAGRTIDNEALANNFFAALGWDRATGKPDRGGLEAMGGMEDVIRDL